MALCRGIRVHQYLEDWLIRAEHSDLGGPHPVLRLDNQPGEVRTQTHSGVFICGLLIPSRFSPCKIHDRQMA